MTTLEEEEEERMWELSWRHFKEKHPVNLTEVNHDNGEKMYCYGCRQEISGSKAYTCTECSEFYLHKLCGELPAEMKHPMHKTHPLTLIQGYETLYNIQLQRPLAFFQWRQYEQQGRSLYPCSVCRRHCGGFHYGCSQCDFYVNVACAVRAQTVELKTIHEHSLNVVLRSALVPCDGCGTEHQGLSYLCNTCYFWIHQDCASLPSPFKHKYHVHPLTLFNFVSWEQYSPECKICGQRMDNGNWMMVYGCKGCNYFVHLKCSSKIKESIPAIKLEHLNKTTLIHLPLPDKKIKPIDQFLKQLNLRADNTSVIDRFMKQHSERESVPSQFSHDHKYTLSDGQKDDFCERICDACVRTISAPFYSCSVCNSFLHKSCAELPKVLLHPCHPQPLVLQNKLHSYFFCKGCTNFCNGFFYSSYGYDLDVKCASLPRYIMHEVHEHPLHLRENCVTEGCAACDKRLKIFAYGCDHCSFNLHYKCALLPRTIWHRYCKHHPFVLKYGPVDGIEEYYCEFCEVEMDPNKGWFYHCDDCDQSFCAGCIYKEEKEFPSIKWGGFYMWDRHPHPVIMVQLKNESDLCGICRLDFRCDFSKIAFKCEQCKIILHWECVTSQGKILFLGYQLEN